MRRPLQSHWLSCKQVSRYLQRMKDFGVRYTIRGIARLIGVADVDWAADEELKIRESQSVVNKSFYTLARTQLLNNHFIIKMQWLMIWNKLNQALSDK